MAFPQPRPQAPQLPQHLLRTIDCQQGAVRAVRFNSKKKPHQNYPQIESVQLLAEQTEQTQLLNLVVMYICIIKYYKFRSTQ